jgi:hypothetical protein
MLADGFRWRKTERSALLACFLGEGKRIGAAGVLTCLGKKKRNYCSLLIVARWEKRGGPKFCGWLARADHGREKAAGCGLGTIRKLAALICFGLREKDGCWLLCILRGRERSSTSGLPRVEERNIRGRDRSTEKQLAALTNREQAEREEWWRLAGAPSWTCSCS